MADLWDVYDSLRYRFGRKATSVAAARKAIEDSIRADEAGKWREALGWALDTLYQMDGTRDSLRGYPPYVKARALLSRPEASDD
jgi:hypothetical protein